VRAVPTSSTAGQHPVAAPDFARAARLGSFLSASGWPVAVVGVVVALVVATRGETFSLPLFLACGLAAVLAGMVVVGVGRALEIAAYVGDRVDRDAAARTIRLPDTRRADTGA
jgi:hypothetical protein